MSALPLTAREARVAELRDRGFTQTQIAARLELSPAAVESCARRIRQKAFRATTRCPLCNAEAEYVWRCLGGCERRGCRACFRCSCGVEDERQAG